MGKLCIWIITLAITLIPGVILGSSEQLPRDKIDSLRTLLPNSEGQEMVDVMNQLSWEYRNLHADSSAYYAQSAYDQATQLKYDNGIIHGLNYLGIAYRNKSDYSKAFEFFVRALKAAEQAGNLEQIGYSNINIGNIYIYQTNYLGAIEYFEKALKPAETLGDQSMVAYCYLNLGRTYLRLKEYIKAEDYFLRTRSIREDLNDREGLITNAVDLAELYMVQGDSEKALKYFFISLEDINKVKNQGALTFSLNNISTIYRDKGEYEQAEKYARQSLDVAVDHGLKNDERKALENLSLIHERQGKYELALGFYKDQINKRDHIFNEENTRTIENLKSRYEVEKKEAEQKYEAAIKESRQRLINTAFIVSFLFVTIIAIVAYRSSIVRKRLNEQIRKQKDRVENDKLLIEEQSRKLEELDFAKSRFFSNISHDLRSPLSIILGNYDQVLNDKENYLSSKSRKYVDVAHKNAKRMLYLTDEINELTKLEEGKLKLQPVLVKMQPYLNLLVNMFSSTAEYKSIDLALNVETDQDQTLQIDPAHFEKIIYNLVSNALKHSKSGDKINISLLRNTDQHLTIQVSDTGEGIPEKSLPYIFDRYYQSPDNKYHVYEGLGIGLALVKELVELHKGTIAVESTLGEGTTFTLDFPIIDVAGEAIIPEKSAYIQQKSSLWADLWEKTYQHDKKVEVHFEANGKEGSINVLLVEDHPEVREYIRSLVEAHYNVYEAEDGKKALEVLNKQSIDLVVTDLMMPWMDGFALLEEMRKEPKYKSIPVLVVSARNTENDKFRVLSQGVNDLLQKPFGQEELLLRISNLLRQKHEWNNEKEQSLLINDASLINDIEKELLEKIEKLIIEKIDNPDLSVLDLADAMAASERKVYRMIKKLTDLTPYEYIKEIRWQFLEKLISNKHVKNATEAAGSIGMKNVTNFKKQFHKRFNRDVDEMIAKVA